MVGNQKRGKCFEQDDDVTKNVHLEVVEFYRKLNSTAFLDWIMSMEDYFNWHVILKNRRVCFVRQS